MRKIKILVDSCADLTGELLDKYDIDYLKMNTVEDGVETPASLRWEYYSPHELYEKMRGGKRITTTQVPVEEFKTGFTKYLEEGYDIIYIGCCSKQSGSVNTGRVVATDLLKEFPDAKIECIDSLSSSIGHGYLGIYAAELLSQGKSFDDIVSAVLDKRKYVNQFVTVHSLDALKRAGRVKGSSAFFGNLLGVKPIIISDADGEQTPIKKAKGRLNSFNEIVDLLADALQGVEKPTVYFAHSDCSEKEIEVLKKIVNEKIDCKEIVTVIIGPIIGSSIGPDAVGVWGIGKEVTYRVGDTK